MNINYVDFKLMGLDISKLKREIYISFEYKPPFTFRKIGNYIFCYSKSNNYEFDITHLIITGLKFGKSCDVYNDDFDRTEFNSFINKILRSRKLKNLLK